MDDDLKKIVLEAIDRFAPLEGEDDKERRKAEEALEARIKGIERSTSAARSNWFWYFGVLAFVFLTIIGLDDGSLFRDTSTAKLPVIGFSVNLRSFLYFAPFLLAIVYIYLHGLIEQLWENLSKLPDRYDAPDGESLPIIGKLPVWLLLELALIKRDKFRHNSSDKRAVNRSGTGMISVWAMSFLTWPATPLLLIWLWWRTLVIHDLILSLWQVAVIAVCVWFGWMSRQQMIREMSKKAEK